MSVFTFSWCRVEGTPILDLKKEYGTFNQLPVLPRFFMEHLKLKSITLTVLLMGQFIRLFLFLNLAIQPFWESIVTIQAC